MCPTHFWGDKDFDFGKLYDAMDWIHNEAHKIGINPCTKEKYGTIRYEFVYLWSKNKKGKPDYPTEEQFKEFNKIIKRAEQKFPKIAKEISEDWYWMFEDE